MKVSNRGFLVFIIVMLSLLGFLFLIITLGSAYSLIYEGMHVVSFAVFIVFFPMSFFILGCSFTSLRDYISSQVILEIEDEYIKDYRFMSEPLYWDNITFIKIIYTRFDAISVRLTSKDDRTYRQNPFRLGCWPLILDKAPRPVYVSLYGMSVSPSRMVEYILSIAVMRSIPFENRSKIDELLQEINKIK